MTPPGPEPAPENDADRSQFWIDRIADSAGGAPSRAEEAWARLEGRYRRRLLAHAERLLGPKLRARYEPEDVVNEAWGRAFKDRRNFTYRGPLSFLHWLKLQVWRVVGDHVRRAKPDEAAPRGDSDEAATPGVDPSASGAGPASRAAQAEMREVLEETLAELPALYRDVLRAFYLEHRSREEIARTFDRLPNTVTTQLKRGLDLWKKAIEAKFGDGSFDSWFGRA